MAVPPVSTTSPLPKFYFFIYLLQILEALALVTADVLFIKYNSPGISNLLPILILSQILVAVTVGLLLIYAIQNLRRIIQKRDDFTLLQSKRQGLSKIWHSPLWLFATLASGAGIVVIFLNLVLFNYYQPLSLYDIVILFTGICWGLFAIIMALSAGAYLVQLVRNKVQSTQTERGGGPKFSEGVMVSLVIWLCFFPSYLAIDQLNQPAYTAGVSPQILYQKNTDGYYTFRIPSLLVIPAGSILNNSQEVGQDLLLTFAEGRQNSALDTGAIDTVMRRSLDAGDTWAPMQVLNRWPSPSEKVKFGNPTAVYDQITGQIFLSYTNMSAANGRQTTFYRSSADGGASWSAPVRLNALESTVLGPGHGIQIEQGVYAGRLLLPAHTPDGCYAIYSDDHGKTWQSGALNGYGNENIMIELQNGTIYMSVRTKIPVSSVHDPLERLFSLSNNGGETWSDPVMHDYLPDPIVMGSVCRSPRSINATASYLITSLPGSYTSRVKMTLYVSEDGAKSWTASKQLYFGPSGYSELGVLSDGTICCLFENGRTQYSDQLTLVKASVDWILA